MHVTHEIMRKTWQCSPSLKTLFCDHEGFLYLKTCYMLYPENYFSDTSRPNREIKNCFEFILPVVNYQSDRSESVLVLKISFTLRIDFD